MSPTETLITAGSKTIVPSTPEFSILTTCSDPSESSILGKSFTGAIAVDAAGAAEPQSCPSRQIDPTGAILISIAFFASEALRLNTKPIISIKKNFEYFICYRFMKIERAAL